MALELQKKPGNPCPLGIYIWRVVGGAGEANEEAVVTIWSRFGILTTEVVKRGRSRICVIEVQQQDQDWIRGVKGKGIEEESTDFGKMALLYAVIGKTGRTS